jgi:hypothetical protein
MAEVLDHVEEPTGPGGQLLRPYPRHPGAPAPGAETPLDEPPAPKVATASTTALDDPQTAVVVDDTPPSAPATSAPAVEPEPSGPERLLTALEAHGGGPLGWQALADATGQSRPTIYRHMARLVREERVEPADAGGWQLINDGQDHDAEPDAPADTDG